MNELIWLNGEVMPISEARISPEDRGFQFADGVYEVIRLYGGRPFALAEHLRRLVKSADGIALALTMPPAELQREIEKLISRSGVGEGMVYLQLTRGVSPRNHLFPPAGTGSTLLFYIRALDPLAPVEQTPAVKLLTVPDERWKRCWIKSIALLPNVLAKNQAVAQGADEAVFNDEGVVTECSASNFFAIIGGKAVTHPVGPRVLPGVTRDVLLAGMRGMGIAVEERAPRLEEAKAADEIFITSTTREISPVAWWDGQKVGRTRELTLRLHHALRQVIGSND